MFSWLFGFRFRFAYVESFYFAATSFRNRKKSAVTVVGRDCATGTGSPLFLFVIRKKKLCWYYVALATPTSWQVTLQLVAQLQREDATTSYLTSSPRLPPFSSPKWKQASAAASVVVGSSLKAALSPSATLSNTAPTATARTNNTTQLS